MPKLVDANVLVGTETHDDAGVYRLSDDIALVQTIDFFPPVVDDPFIYGQIAAANALSDIYAMGAEPKTVLNLVAYPDDELGGYDWLGKILEGGADRCAAAGAVILGGHSVRDREIKFGLSVTGVVHPSRVMTNAGARPGDRLVLTKPLGTGFVTTANKKGACPPEVLAVACQQMVQLNSVGWNAVRKIGGASAITDITGFGLCGHAYEMADGSRVSLHIAVDQLPLIPGADKLIRYPTRASATNLDYVRPFHRIDGRIDPVRAEFLWDAQTSGGLLIAVAADRAQALVDECRSSGAPFASIVGSVQPQGTHALVFHNS